jgi:hypothetical protein
LDVEDALTLLRRGADSLLFLLCLCPLLLPEQRIGKTQTCTVDVEHATATVTSHFNVEYSGKKGRLMRYLEAINHLDEDATTQDPLK